VCVDAPTCAKTCGLITASCVSTNRQFTNLAQCLQVCPAWPVGTAADTAGDTLGCRQYHAGVANSSATNADAHCAHTGQSPVGICGTNCQAFCDQSIATCGTSGTNSQFASLAACTTACAQWSAGVSGATAGDSLACRLYHVTVAGGSAALATAHCSHTGTSGGGVCVATTTSTATTASTAMTSSTGSTTGISGASSAAAASGLLVAALAIVVLSL